MRLHLHLHQLGGACAGVFLLACAAPGQAPPAVASPVHGASAALSGAAAPARPPGASEVAAADAWYALGRQHHAAQRRAEAQAAYAAALQHDAAHRDAGNGLAVLAAERGDYAAAIDLWRGLTAPAGRGAAAPAYLFGNLGYAYLLGGQVGAAVAALEQACLLDPLRAASWEHLGLALEQDGQADRAARMRQQALALRSHDARADYALLGQARQPGLALAPLPLPLPVPVGVAEAATWPPELSAVRVGADGMFELVRATAVAALAAVPAPALAGAGSAAGAPGQASFGAAALRLEISNGNGVTGMAAGLGRLVGGAGLRVVRVGNEANFRLARTRIAYRPAAAAVATLLAGQLGSVDVGGAAAGQQADIRIVLGHDLRDPVSLRRRYLQQRAASAAAPLTAFSAVLPGRKL